MPIYYSIDGKTLIFEKVRFETETTVDYGSCTCVRFIKCDNLPTGGSKDFFQRILISSDKEYTSFPKMNTGTLMIEGLWSRSSLEKLREKISYHTLFILDISILPHLSGMDISNLSIMLRKVDRSVVQNLHAINFQTLLMTPSHITEEIGELFSHPTLERLIIDCQNQSGVAFPSSLLPKFRDNPEIRELFIQQGESQTLLDNSQPQKSNFQSWKILMGIIFGMWIR